MIEILSPLQNMKAEIPIKKKHDLVTNHPSQKSLSDRTKSDQHRHKQQVIKIEKKAAIMSNVPQVQKPVQHHTPKPEKKRIEIPIPKKNEAIIPIPKKHEIKTENPPILKKSEQVTKKPEIVTITKISNPKSSQPVTLSLQEQERLKLIAFVDSQKKKPEQKIKKIEKPAKLTPIESKSDKKTNKIIVKAKAIKQNVIDLNKVIAKKRSSNKIQREDYDLNDSFIDNDEEQLDSEDAQVIEETLGKLREKKQKVIEDDSADIVEDDFDELQRQDRKSRKLGKLIDKYEEMQQKKQFKI